MSQTRYEGASSTYGTARYYGRGRAFAALLWARYFVTGRPCYYRIRIS